MILFNNFNDCLSLIGHFDKHFTQLILEDQVFGVLDVFLSMLYSLVTDLKILLVV
jgi:hypothetical protein